MEIEDRIKSHVSWFLDKINIPIIENYYIEDLQNWDALCASLTILNDLQRAKKEYYLIQDLNHLEAIGIMQTIYIEQDCMLTFQNSILESNRKAALNKYEEIRKLRNEAFGHPSEKLKAKGKYSRHFFDIVDCKKHILKLINWEVDGEIESSQFVLIDTVKTNSRITLEYMEEIKIEFITKVKNQMANYKIRIDKLFLNANYTFEKLLTKEHDRIVIDTYDSIDLDIETARDGLIERKVLEDYERQIDVLKFYSDKLKPLFNVKTYKDIEFYSYAVTLRDGITKFKKALDEIERILE